MSVAAPPRHLNFACGPARWPGFENSDINGWGDRHVDLRDRPYPYARASAELILLSHALFFTDEEKQPIHESPIPILAEFARILAPGGWLRIDENPFRLYRSGEYLDYSETQREEARGYPQEQRYERDKFLWMLGYLGFTEITEHHVGWTTGSVIPAGEETLAAITGNRNDHYSIAIEARR